MALLSLVPVHGVLHVDFCQTVLIFFVSTRKVNAVTKPDTYPLPEMDDCIDRVGSAAYVSKLDLLKGYWQVTLTDRACEISALVTALL